MSSARSSWVGWIFRLAGGISFRNNCSWTRLSKSNCILMLKSVRLSNLTSPFCVSASWQSRQCLSSNALKPEDVDEAVRQELQRKKMYKNWKCFIDQQWWRKLANIKKRSMGFGFIDMDRESKSFAHQSWWGEVLNPYWKEYTKNLYLAESPTETFNSVTWNLPIQPIWRFCWPKDSCSSLQLPKPRKFI